MSDYPSFGQLQPEDTLDPRGVDDVLDEGFVPPDRPLGIEGYGNTAYEHAVGEGLDRRLAREVPEEWEAEDEAATTEDDEVEAVLADDELAVEAGSRRAGRLVAPGSDGFDDDAEAWAEDIGIDGAGASAEEAAMHVIDDE